MKDQILRHDGSASAAAAFGCVHNLSVIFLIASQNSSRRSRPQDIHKGAWWRGLLFAFHFEPLSADADDDARVPSRLLAGAENPDTAIRQAISDIRHGSRTTAARG